MIGRWSTMLFVVIAPCALLAQSTGAPPQDPQAPTFRLRVDSVSVDVSVTDKQGKPILDLKPEDFEIKEAGKLQTIETFRLIDRTETGKIIPTFSRQVLSFSDMARETADPENSLFIVFLDDYHTMRGNSLNVRQHLAKFAKQLSPRDLVAVLTPNTPIAATTFSRDTDGLAMAMMNFEGRKYNYIPKTQEEMMYNNFPPDVQEQIRNDVTIRALRSACALLSSLREGRKTLLYVSEGMAAHVPAGVGTGTNSTMFPPRTAPTAQQQQQQMLAQTSRNFFDSQELVLRMRDIFTTCSRGNVSIYPLDPRGLAPSEFGVAAPVDPALDRSILNEALDSLRTLADQTDGRAIIGKNNPMPDLQKMVEELGSYYLLGYTSTLAPRDGRFHEIDVKVRRKDVDVRARKGYWAYSEEEIKRAAAPPKPGPPEDVAAALDELASAVEPTNRRSVIFWVGATRSETEKAAVTLVWEAAPNAPDAAAERVDQIDVTATTGNGETVYTGSVARDPNAFKPSGRVTFAAPAGPLRLKINTKNARGQKLDSEDVNEMIPDFTAVGPTITTPQMFRARTPIQMAEIRKSSTALPTVARIFSRTERVLLRFDAYGPAGTKPELALRLLNKMGEPLSATLPAPSVTQGNTFEADLTLAGLPPGDYLVEIAATSGTDRSVKLIGIRVTG